MTDDWKSLETIDLVLSAKDGKRAALEELFERYQSRCLGMVRARLGQKLRGNLESVDVMQEAMIEALGGLENFDMKDESSLIRWLAVIVENKIRVKHRYHGAQKRARDNEVAMQARANDSAETRDIAIPSPGPTPSLDMRKQEEEDALQDCLAELPQRYREVILLRDYAGSDWEAVARETSSPSAEAARMMHARAVARLGELLRSRGHA